MNRSTRGPRNILREAVCSATSSMGMEHEWPEDLFIRIGPPLTGYGSTIELPIDEQNDGCSG